jgi:hypothetical protein
MEDIALAQELKRALHAVEARGHFGLRRGGCGLEAPEAAALLSKAEARDASRGELKAPAAVFGMEALAAAV